MKADRRRRKWYWGRGEGSWGGQWLEMVEERGFRGESEGPEGVAPWLARGPPKAFLAASIL